MVDHQEIFERVKSLLSRHVRLDIDVLDYGTQFTVACTGIWLQSDPDVLTIGYGLSHVHYDPKRDDVRKGIERLFNLLTRRRRITTYSKGGRVFRERIEIELEENKFEHFGTSTIWWVPFWRRTSTNVHFEDPLLEFSKVEREVMEIYKLI